MYEWINSFNKKNQHYSMSWVIHSLDEERMLLLIFDHQRKDLKMRIVFFFSSCVKMRKRRKCWYGDYIFDGREIIVFSLLLLFCCCFRWCCGRGVFRVFILWKHEPKSFIPIWWIVWVDFYLLFQRFITLIKAF